MTDLVVVGGGIVGASTCYYAKQLGAKCTLIERDGIASHASGYAFGGLHPRVGARTESEMPRFAFESFKEHEALDSQLESAKGGSSTWRRRSSISIAWNEFEASMFKTQAADDSSASHWLDARDLRELEPRISREALGGLMIENSAEVDSAALTKALFEIADPDFHLGEIASVERARDRIIGVRTKQGTVIEGDMFVFAMGPWSSEAFNWLGIKCLVKPLKGQILRLRIDGPAFQHSFSTNGNYMSTKPDGLLWIGTTEEDTEFDESPTMEGRREIIHVLERMLADPSIFEVVEQTACLRPITPDGELILGCLPGVSNAFIGTGGGRKGILYGPLMGKYLANLALATLSSDRWSSLTPERFENRS